MINNSRINLLNEKNISTDPRMLKIINIKKHAKHVVNDLFSDIHDKSISLIEKINKYNIKKKENNKNGVRANDPSGEKLTLSIPINAINKTNNIFLKIFMNKNILIFLYFYYI